MVQRYFPGRHAGEDYNNPPSSDLEVTSLVKITNEDWSGKARRAEPTGPDDNKWDAPGSAGIIEFREV